MSQLFARKPIEALQPPGDSAHSLKRVLGAGDLIMLAIGAVIGSFLNVVIHRVPLEESVVFPNSRCPSCGAVIAFYDNIPVLSYVALRGKCRGSKDRGNESGDGRIKHAVEHPAQEDAIVARQQIAQILPKVELGPEAEAESGEQITVGLGRRQHEVHQRNEGVDQKHQEQQGKDDLRPAPLAWSA